MDANNSIFLLSILAEVMSLLLLVLLIYNFLLRKDKKSLLEYIISLKNKISQLKSKLIKQQEHSDVVFQLLSGTTEHIKASYEKKYNHELGSSYISGEGDSTEQNIHENNSKEHFIYILGYQSLKAELNALENSNSPESTWDKIKENLEPLVDNFRTLLPDSFNQVSNSPEFYIYFGLSSFKSSSISIG